MIRAIAAGVLIADPQLRRGAKAAFVTATLRSGYGDAAVLVNVIAFGEVADRLGGLRQGDTLSVAGKAEPRAWTGKTGELRASLGITVEQIVALPVAKGRAATAPRPRRPRSPARPSSPVGGRPFDDEIPL